ncbi:MAG: hypothetical protein KA248_05425 [Kiritimatiellae bacterium]|nr:hypothetical protein [Kiritimatiellia bacterium]
MKKRMMAALFWLAAAGAGAQVPARIHYQGRLVHGTNLFNGTVPIALQLYSNASPVAGEAVLFGSTNASVSVVDGLYSTVLESDPPAAALLDALARPGVYLQVSVDGTALLPREPVAAAGYALLAEGLGRTTVLNRTQTAFHIGTNGLYGQAPAFTPAFGTEGLFLESALPYGESAGLFISDVTIALWTAGYYLLSIYDEDDFSGGPVTPKLRLDSDGNLYLAGRLYETNQFTGVARDESDLSRRVADLEARVAELEHLLAPR